jgi:neutral trehalase
MLAVRPQHAWPLIQSVLEQQRDDGMIPHQMRPTGTHTHLTQPPILAWGAWTCYQRTEDREILTAAAPALARYLNWDMDNRAQGDLLGWQIDQHPDGRGHSNESGLDNSPRFDSARPQASVDLSVFAAQDALYLSRIYSELGRQVGGDRWAQKAADLSKAIHEQLWDDERGFYVDRFTDNDQLSGTMAVTGFLPLLLDDIPDDRCKRLAEHLDDATTFGAAFPVPSVSLSDPTFSTDMWRGATWINLNYLIATGLRRRGLTAEADSLAEKTIAFVQKYYEEYGVVFEFYDAKDEWPPVSCDRKGRNLGRYDIRKKMDSIRDYHWTAAMTLSLLLGEWW